MKVRDVLTLEWSEHLLLIALLRKYEVIQTSVEMFRKLLLELIRQD